LPVKGLALERLGLEGLVPGEGFEPSVEDPKSSALPLGHPGKVAWLPVVAQRRVCGPKEYAEAIPTGNVTSGRGPAFGLIVRVVLVALLVLATAACGGYRFPGGAAGGSGTVSGQVTTLARCGPVQPADKQQCSGRPVGGFEMDFSGDDRTVATSTDSNGFYSVELPSGTWKVSVKGYLRIISGPPAVTVSPGAHVVANYVVGAGMLVPVPAG
jgi:hypothetical protein